MKNSIFKICVSILGDVIFGFIAAIFVHFIAGEMIPQILTTQLCGMNGAIHLSLNIDTELMKRIFSVWHCFCALFGIRFVVAYITGNYTTFKGKFIKEEE